MTMVHFNSLSRDHKTDFETYISFWLQKLFQLPLSGSRSLGAYKLPHHEVIDGISTPSLGITRSAMRILARRPAFQLPLSGSHIRAIAGRMLALGISTPSLGITTLEDLAAAESDSNNNNFNSLSRDHSR